MKKLQLLFFTFLVTSLTCVSAMLHPGDSIEAFHTSILPVIDGDGSDVAWSDANWIYLNYTWIPYNITLPAAECSGRYKVTWNKTTNLLYFLVEITDESFVTGYVFSKSDGSYPDYDAVEILFDEDRPGGYHAKNNTAFAYHITGGNANTDHDVVDIYDTTPGDAFDWSSNKVNYSSHFPEFKRTNVGHNYVWEFSMMVIDSTYTPTDDPVLFKKTLTEGKKMGLTMAYCDSDIPSANPSRENFIASKYETLANNNISWENSTTFAHLTLKENVSIGIEKNVDNASTKIWVDGANKLNLNLGDSWQNPQIQLYDISGRLVMQRILSNYEGVDLDDYQSGCYLVRIKDNFKSISKKVFVN